MSHCDFIMDDQDFMISNNTYIDEDIMIPYEDSKQYINGIIIPGVCTIGILGNLINLVVLTRKKLTSSMDTMERSAHTGLISLAFCDLLFCIAALPKGIKPNMEIMFTRADFWLYYNSHGVHLINVLTMTSTWLTVIMAASRYLAICHPLKAREIVDVKSTKIALISVFVICIFFNLPRFWETSILTTCNPRHEVIAYYLDMGPLIQKEVLHLVLQWLWAILGNLIPLLILAFCNICLILALRESTRMRRQFRVHSNKAESHNRITPTLIIIVLMFFILVSPSEILHFLFKFFVDASEQQKEAYLLAASVLNVMVTINYSFNFVLYCVINVQFRRIVKDLLLCMIRPAYQRRRGTATSSYVSASRSTRTSMRQSAMETDM